MNNAKNFIFLILLSSSCMAQVSMKEYYMQALEAHKVSDNALFYALILKAHKLHPYHQGALYQCSLAAALCDKPNEAMIYLTKAIHINASFDLYNNDLKSLFKRKDFKRLCEKQIELLKPIVQSDTAFTLNDRQLHIESITVDSEGTLYLGSIHKRKISTVTIDGSTNDFTSSAQDGLAAIMSLKIDTVRDLLWVGSSPMVEMDTYDSTLQSNVYKYDLKTKKLVQRYSINDALQKHVLGDIVLNKNGEVFTADSQNNVIFTVNEKTKKLEPYFTSKDFWNIQGITFSTDGNYLFVADYIKGVFRLDVVSKQLMLLKINFDLSVKSIDGLIFYENSLIAIQNSINPMRVTRYNLNPSKDTLLSYTIIDSKHPAFNEPTNGCVYHDKLFYIANSQWSGYTDDHKIKPTGQLSDIVILNYTLK